MYPSLLVFCTTMSLTSPLNSVEWWSNRWMNNWDEFGTERLTSRNSPSETMGNNEKPHQLGYRWPGCHSNQACTKYKSRKAILHLRGLRLDEGTLYYMTTCIRFSLRPINMAAIRAALTALLICRESKTLEFKFDVF